jgi:hypothetical protein
VAQGAAEVPRQVAAEGRAGAAVLPPGVAAVPDAVQGPRLAAEVSVAAARRREVAVAALAGAAVLPPGEAVARVVAEGAVQPRAVPGARAAALPSAAASAFRRDRVLPWPGP